MSPKKSSNTLNSTPNELLKKTGSAPKVIAVAGLQALAILFVMAGLLLWWRGGEVTVHIGSATIRASVANTEAERAQGLQSETYISDTRGMLFVFPYDAKWQIWMKDMTVPIDIVWLDAGKKVVGVQKNVSPDSYPDHYTPPEDARYVLELASGVAQKAHIELGVRAEFTVSSATK